MNKSYIAAQIVAVTLCIFAISSRIRAIETETQWAGSAQSFDQAATQPVGLSCEPQTIDLGIVEVNEEFQAKWRINNRLNRDIHIVKIRPGCGCTTAALQNASDGLIAAGSFAEVIATVSTKHVRGPKNVRIIVETDAPDFPVLEVNVKLSVTPPIKLDFKSMDLGEVKMRLGAVKSMMIRADKAIDFNIVAIKAVESDRMKVDIKELTKGKEYQLIISIIPGAKVGTMRTIVKLETDNPKIDVIDIPVFAKIIDGP